MKDLGMMHYFLGMEVWQNANGISMGQGMYVVEILKRFRMMFCKSMTTPMASNLKLLSDAASEGVDAIMYHQMIGSLMYLMNTRPDICFAMNTLSQFLMNPIHVHLIATKHILRYLKGTVDYGIGISWIRRLTWNVMLIHIGKVVPSIGRELLDVASVWD